MKFIDCEYSEFVNKVKNRIVILFGVSSGWDYYFSVLPTIDRDVLNNVSFVVDNDKDKHDKECKIAGYSFPIKKPDVLREYKDVVVLITVRFKYCEKICEQLLSYEMPDEVECYSIQLLYSTKKEIDNSCVDKYFIDNTKVCIPKRIHSFWFSGEDKPDTYKKCIESWYKYCPDYEICEWNSHNYDIEKNIYMRQAFEKRKWAFVSDYARLDVVYTYGGIYLDMDVELMASIDFLRCAKGFFCRQSDGSVDLGSGFGAVQKSSFIKKLLNEYDELEFYNEKGEMNLLPQPARLGHVFYEHGLGVGHQSEIMDDMIVLSDSFICCACGKEWQLTGKEVGVHWHNGGWLSKNEKEEMVINSQYRQKIKSLYFKKDMV